MKNLVIAFCLIPVLGWSQSPPPPADTVFFLFDQQSQDSLCSYTYMDINVPKEGFTRRYRKEVEREANGRIKSITFRICNEEFAYYPNRHTVDTISNTTSLKFSSVETADKMATQKIAAYIENNKDSQSLMVLFNYDVLDTYVMERMPDGTTVSYQTAWVEKIE